MFVVAFMAQLAVKALNVGVLCRLARLNQQGRDAVFIGPLIESFAGKLRALVCANRLRPLRSLTSE